MNYTEEQVRGAVDFINQREATSHLPSVGNKSYIDLYIDCLNKDKYMANYIEVLEGILKKEIKKIPRPFGLYLSGGIDSGILAALAKPDFAVTCRFEEGEKYDEYEYADKIAKHLNIPLRIVKPQKYTFEGFLHDAVKIIGKPINSVSIVPWYCLMAETQGQTMINGEGADEQFGGYARYLILKQIFELYEQPELENYKPMLDSLFGSVHTKMIGIESNADSLARVMSFEFRETLPDIIFMEKQLAKHFKVDFHQPFMSHAVKQFAKELPSKYKIKGFETKFLLREMARKYLPSSVANRKCKSGLVAPVNKWMGWMEKGEFNKEEYMKHQRKIL